MSYDQTEMASAASAVLFAAVFLFGRRIHPLQSVVHDRRTIISFGAGISTAYLFVRMMPELGEARETLGEGGGVGNGMVAYLFALIGFLLVYGLDHFRRGLSAANAASKTAVQSLPEVSSRVIGMVLYVLLLTYVLVQENGTSVSGILQYAMAISFHFLAIDHSLRDEMGDDYDRRIRFVFAIMCLLGWLLAQLVSLPNATTALLLAFVSGAVIVNSAVMEFPTDKDGRFAPFALGSVLYGIVLMAV
jgi:hypothetical protein